MKTLVNKEMFDDFRAFNCKAKTCEGCEQNRICLLNAFFNNAVGEGGDGTDIELAVKILEDHGFHVTDAREERARPTDNGHAIDDCGIKPTGAILLRAVPVFHCQQVKGWTPSRSRGKPETGGCHRKKTCFEIVRNLSGKADDENRSKKRT
jgi:hypothetical protein